MDEAGLQDKDVIVQVDSPVERGLEQSRDFVETNVDPCLRARRDVLSGHGSERQCHVHMNCDALVLRVREQSYRVSRIHDTTQQSGSHLKLSATSAMQAMMELVLELHENDATLKPAMNCGRRAGGHV
eukprot:6962199-Prymnesium_polylepis.1